MTEFLLQLDVAGPDEDEAWVDVTAGPGIVQLVAEAESGDLDSGYARVLDADGWVVAERIGGTWTIDPEGGLGRAALQIDYAGFAARLLDP